MELIDIELITNYLSVRTFKLTRNLQTKEVKHFSFIAWPDHHIPRSDHLIKLFRTYWQTVFPCTDKRILVHCRYSFTVLHSLTHLGSAGVGRTGTFCVLDQVIKLLDSTNAEFDHDIVLDTILRYRDQRVTIVETYVNLFPSPLLFMCVCRVNLCLSINF